jgi:hypothetical protein
MTARIKEGLQAAARHPKLAILIWAWYGLLALVPALPAWTWWNAVLGSSPEAASVLKRFGLGLYLDLTRSEGVSGLGLLMVVTAAVGVVAVVSSAFVFGGMLEVLGNADDRRPFMHRFFRGGGHFFWRFLRLAVIAGVCLVLVTALVSAIVVAITTPLRGSEWEPGGYLAGFVNIAAMALVGALFLLALDYARIRVARDDSRRMLKAYFGGLGFVLRRLFATYGIAIPFVVALAALMAAYVAYETNAPAAGSWGAILVLFVIQQIVVLGRVFLRVALVGAERSFHAAVLPSPVPAVAQTIIEPAVEGALQPAGPAEPVPQQNPIQ